MPEPVNSGRDRYICDSCGLMVLRHDVETRIRPPYRNREGQWGAVVLEAAPMCEHADGTRWAMRMHPAPNPPPVTEAEARA